ncbi:hypothetical protein PENFLA_c016G06074 [Penicillium flavigenum]|uniref:MYND-type domain-containing protein n=1 Tax=Penicillium flavigenum TaxID=254877 RepID=A0A1V6T2X2_9EURO|nr:hypothetical protein PENFLA_c016G06074 [Penicillium flavigenum]
MADGKSSTNFIHPTHVPLTPSREFAGPLLPTTIYGSWPGTLDSPIIRCRNTAVTDLVCDLPKSKMPRLTFCRFDDRGNLALEEREIRDTTFIAISHVWGEADWLSAPQIPFRVLATTHKVRFITEKLPSLVKSGYFWMDILSVDQSSKQSRSAAVDQIPAIYKKARLTIVIREPGGVMSCCASSLMAKCSRSLDTKTAETMIDDHIRTQHPHGLQERWLERVWPLQELHLSDHLLFAVCDPPETDYAGTMEPVPPSSIEASAVYFNIFQLASQWSTRLYVHNRHVYKQILKECLHDFLQAILRNRSVSRAADETYPSAFHVLSESTWSGRRTGHPRDLVLALFPQFAWYHTPRRERLKEMEFADTFQDCMQQVQNLARSDATSAAWDAFLFGPQNEKQNWPHMIVRPKIVQGVLHGFRTDSHSSWAPAKDVPHPENLGDFCRLMHLHTSVDMEYPFTTPMNNVWEIHPIGACDSMDIILRVCNSTAFFSRSQLTAGAVQEMPWQLRMADLERLLDYHPGHSSANENVSRSAPAGTQSLPAPYAIWIQLERLHARVKHRNDGANRTRNLLSPQVYLKEPWGQITSTFTRYDSASMREALLLLMASSRCGFSLSTLPWIRARLRPYILQFKGFRGEVKFETLVLGAKDLDLSRMDVINAFLKECDPYVTSTRYYGSGLSEKRVVGLAPVVEQQDQDTFAMFLSDQSDVIKDFQAVSFADLADPAPKTPAYDLELTITRCETCDGTVNVERCSGCESVGYCSKQCQALDLSNHQETCEWVQHIRALEMRGPFCISSKTSLDKAPINPGNSTPHSRVPYRYRPLGSNQIRLVYLYSGNGLHSLECDVQHLNMDSGLPYLAISYACSEEETSQRLLIGRNYYLSISRSLFEALRDTRAPHGDGYCIIWVDTVCIDHDDANERFQQLPLMREIYHRATNAIIYIGPETHNSRLGIELAHHLMLWRVGQSTVPLPPETDAKWEALRALLRRPWPTRTWPFVQSLLCKSIPTMACGRAKFDWLFIPLIAAEARRGGFPRHILPHGDDGTPTPDAFLKDLEFLGHMTWTTSGTQSLSLRHLLHICQGTQSADARDLILAPLLLARDREDFTILSHPTATVSDIFTETATRIIERSQSLDILGTVAVKQMAGLPSWVPDWSIRRAAVPLSSCDMPYSRNQPPEVQRQQSFRYRYSAGGNSTANAQIRIQEGRLIVRGFVLCRVEYVSCQIKVGVMIRSKAWKQWLQVNQEACKRLTSYRTAEKVKHAFWMTLIGGKTHDQSQATMAYRNRFEAFAEVVADSPKRTVSRLFGAHSQRSTTQLREQHQMASEYTSALASTADNRSWCTTNDGLMGLVPSEAQPGDAVFVSLGSQVPLVVRQDRLHYTLVGECYMHGIMKGEALKYPGSNPEDITIV